MLRRLGRWLFPPRRPSPAEPAHRRGPGAWLRRYWAYPTFLIGLSGLVRTSDWMIRDEGVGTWATTALIVLPVGFGLSYLYFRRTGDLPGERWERTRSDEDDMRVVARRATTYAERERRELQVMRGAFRWASASEEGRTLGLGEAPRLFASARADTGEPSRDTRIAIERIVPGQIESEVEARWVLPGHVLATVRPGTVLTLRDGRRVVGHLRVNEVGPPTSLS